MNITILGTGMVGRTLAESLLSHDHRVTMGTRDVASTEEKMGEGSFSLWHSAHASISLLPFAEAVKWADLVINALNGRHTLDALTLCDKNDFHDMLMIDLSNPLDFSGGFPPTLLEWLENTNSLGEAVQAFLPEAKVVKTLNTMSCAYMLAPEKIHAGNHVNFISGNDADAKQKVREFLMSFGWKDENLLDLGDISNARGTEGYLLLWTRIYSATQDGAFNIQIVR